jgi:hypothetical protein
MSANQGNFEAPRSFLVQGTSPLIGHLDFQLLPGCESGHDKTYRIHLDRVWYTTLYRNMHFLSISIPANRPKVEVYVYSFTLRCAGFMLASLRAALRLASFIVCKITYVRLHCELRLPPVAEIRAILFVTRHDGIARLQ